MTGEAESAPLRLQFDPSVKLAFRGSSISSDGGLLLHRELDACSTRPALCIQRGPVAEISWKAVFSGRTLTGGKPNGECRLEKEKVKAEKAPDPHHVRNFLELIKNLAETYLFAKPAEKREIVEWATSNRRVSGKSVYLEPANWLLQVETAIAGLIGVPALTTSRTSIDEEDTSFIKLLKIIKSDKYIETEYRLNEILEK